MTYIGQASPQTTFDTMNNNSKRHIISMLDNNSIRSMSKTSLVFNKMTLEEKKHRDTLVENQTRVKHNAQTAKEAKLYGDNYSKIQRLFEQHFQLSAKLKIDMNNKSPRRSNSKASQLFLTWGDSPILPWYKNDTFVAHLNSELGIVFPCEWPTPPGKSCYPVRKAFANAVFNIIKTKPKFKSVKSWDVIRFSEESKNDGVVGIYDGTEIVPLDHDTYYYGMIPKTFVAFEPHTPDYWEHTSISNKGEINMGDGQYYNIDMVWLNLKLRPETVRNMMRQGSYEEDDNSCSYTFTKSNHTCKIYFHGDGTRYEDVMRRALKQQPLEVEFIVNKRSKQGKLMAVDHEINKEGATFLFMKEILVPRPAHAFHHGNNNA